MTCVFASPIHANGGCIFDDPGLLSNAGGIMPRYRRRGRR